MLTIGKREKIEDYAYYQSLYGHTYDCLKILHTYIDINYFQIKDFCEYWKIDSELFIKNLFIFIYFHDAGKLIHEFQENIKKGKTSYNFPHSIYSFYLLKDFNYESIVSIDFELLAILGHHTQLHNSIYDDQRNVPTFLKENIFFFIKNIYNIYEDLKFDKFFNLDISVNPNFNFKYLKFIKFRDKFNKESSKFNDKIFLKSLFSFFFSILQTCDDYSSYNFHAFVKNFDNINNEIAMFENILDNPNNYVWNLDCKKYLDELFNIYNPYDFQKVLYSNPHKFTLLFAPCGRGKTEAALGWALAALNKFNKRKIIFAMPTQVTSNAMWDRLCYIFGENNVGLYHGKSFIKLADSLNFKDNDEIFSEVFKGNVFFKPITITTIDHLIYSFVHGFSQADFALGNIQSAVVIFDEVHYYDDKALNHLFTLYDFLRKMNIPHILMSGTLPEFIIEGLKNYENVIDYEGLNFKPFKISYHDSYLIKTKEKFYLSNELIKEINFNYDNDLKQFFIFNTIDRAKEFYTLLKKIRDFDIVLYHSQFTHFDRIKKENEIIQKCSDKHGFILIATQIIEISLDISADVMYTELAPPDALGQRGGRLNRKKENGSYQMKIFESESHVPYDKNLINKTRENMKIGNVTYLSFKEWCDQVYDDKNLEFSNLIHFFNRSVLFGYHPKDISFSEEEGNKFEIRDSSFQKIDVIPLEIYDNDEHNLIVENQVKIPFWWIKKDENENNADARIFFNEIKGNRQFIISKMKYSYEMGFNKNIILNLDDFNEHCL